MALFQACKASQMQFSRRMLLKFVVTCTFLSLAAAQTFTNCQPMSGTNYNLWWTLDRAAGTITFAMEGKVPAGKDSYIAVGFQPESVQTVEMEGADACIAGLHSSSTTGFLNDFKLNSKDPCGVGATTFGVCQDARFGGTDDVTKISLIRQSDVIRAIWSRKLKTGDAQDVDLTPLVDKNMMVIYATGPLDRTSTDAAPKPVEHFNSQGYRNGGRLLRLGAPPGNSTCTPLIPFAAGTTTGGSADVAAGSTPVPVTPVATAATAAAVSSAGCTATFKGVQQSYAICRDLGSGFTFRWSFSDQNVLNGTLSKQTSGWLGFGINPTSPEMVGSSALIALPLASGLTVSQFFLESQTSSGVKPGGSLQVLSSEAEVVSGVLTLAFALQLTPAQTAGATNLIWGAGGGVSNANTISQHTDRDSGTVDLKAGSVSLEKEGSTRKVHGSLGFISWGFLLPIGVMFARYLKAHDPLWFNLHRGVQTVGYALAIATLVLGLMLGGGESDSRKAHAAIAWIITVGATLQALAHVLRPNKAAKGRVYWNWYHHWVGRVILILAVIQIYLGLKLINAGTTLTVLYSVVLGLEVAAFLALELWFWWFPVEKAASATRKARTNSTSNLNGQPPSSAYNV